MGDFFFFFLFFSVRVKGSAVPVQARVYMCCHDMPASVPGGCSALSVWKKSNTNTHSAAWWEVLRGPSIRS